MGFGAESPEIPNGLGISDHPGEFACKTNHHQWLVVVYNEQLQYLGAELALNRCSGSCGRHRLCGSLGIDPHC